VNTALEVVTPGLLTTVQDDGRPGLGHLGVPRSGACDPWSLAIANALVGNEPGAAALELTLVGPEVRASTDCLIGVAGSDLGGIVMGSGHRLEPGRSHRLAAGDVVAFPGPASQRTGARAYLALPGGVDVPVVLGSRSTCLPAGFGGLDGRPLATGDRIGCGRSPGDGPTGAVWPPEPVPTTIRILAGPDAADAVEDLERLTTAWTASPTSDRMGVRLDGPALAMPAGGGSRRAHGVCAGAIQLPPDGRPIVLLADAQPTGGYPVPGVAISADLSFLGQLRPGAVVRFAVVAQADAVAAARRSRTRLHGALAAIAEAGRWDELWRSARG
jgi:antagonist of KipI